MQIEKIEVGSYCANCYFVSDERTRRTLIIDPGAEAEQLIRHIEHRQLLPEGIAITHGHFDHVGAAAALSQKWHLPIWIHGQETAYMQERSHPIMSMGAEVLDELLAALPQNGRYVSDQEAFEAAGQKWQAIEVPGHTDHSLCFYHAEAGILFSGDTLFAGSVGRTDLYHGEAAELIRQIREKLLRLPDETRVLPGHGMETTIGRERKENPFLW